MIDHGAYDDLIALTRSLAPRTSSKRRLSDEDMDGGTHSPADKRPRARGVLPPAVLARIASLQSTFDANSLALDQSAGWNDSTKRVLRITAVAQDLLDSARSLADETAADLGDLAALDQQRADRAPGVDPTPNLRTRMTIVDTAQQRIRSAQTRSAAAHELLKTELGSPWTTDEEAHHTWLQQLRNEEDHLQNVLLVLLYLGHA